MSRPPSPAEMARRSAAAAELVAGWTNEQLELATAPERLVASWGLDEAEARRLVSTEKWKRRK